MGLVRPVLEYDSCVWDSKGVAIQQEVRNRVARFVTRLILFVHMSKWCCQHSNRWSDPHQLGAVEITIH